MSQFNSLKYFWLFSISLLAPTSTQARDYPSAYRPYSSELKGDRNEFDGWDEAAFARLSIGDPILKRAYSMMFGSAVNPNLYFSRSELNAAAADIRKRGDTVTPMLIKLMHENEETGFESSVLVHIGAVGTIDVAPYLEYAREVLRKRTWAMSASLAGCAANLIAKHGTQEDGELLKWAMETRPYVADSVTRKLDELNSRLGLPKQGTRRDLRDSKSTQGASDRIPQREPRRAAVAKHETPSTTKSWMVWVLLAVIAIALIRFLLKNRKGMNS